MLCQLMQKLQHKGEVMKEGSFVICTTEEKWGIGRIVGHYELANVAYTRVDFSYAGPKSIETRYAQNSLKIIKDVPAILNFETSKRHRQTHCFSCKRDLDSRYHKECNSCKWIKCHCGACGCSYENY